ncbi:MAG: 16S rRNA (guanine966-N2)-methyltransferase [Thiomicrorhabdus sp.]|nr:MAG: 16S rRNA (guanine966-N2)-methyltransferase [Thiomicrorhabdus sp.]
MPRKLNRKPSRKQTSQIVDNKTSRGGRSKLGEVRIIGGDWRGRKLPVLQSDGLRPTSDRVRETIFNWLQFDIAGANCLDVFAGSGALGFEALSRGAKSATFLELSMPAVKQLQRNLQLLKASNAQVIQGDSLQWLDKPAEQHFDLIFLDPPFNQDLMQQAVDKLFISGIVSSGDDDGGQKRPVWLYIEQEKLLDWPKLPEGWGCHREKLTSQVRFGLFCYQG